MALIEISMNPYNKESEGVLWGRMLRVHAPKGPRQISLGQRLGTDGLWGRMPRILARKGPKPIRSGRRPGTAG
jgi:hypothetical protein